MPTTAPFAVAASRTYARPLSDEMQLPVQAVAGVVAASATALTAARRLARHRGVADVDEALEKAAL
ncbi:hypothetical protein ACFU5O_03945 [Streptomyces sp. NPDC057445]|uniref:hypothetical protein n=1 Tax=Streptomyces sp. NPDC057445 TaxID=3346136 RepID=UPI0036B67C59